MHAAIKFLFLPLFVTTLLGLSSVAQDTIATPSSSFWYGEMDAGPRVFRFFIESKPADDAAKPTTVLTSIDEGNAKFRLADFTIDGSSVRFKLTSTKAAYEGTLSEDKTTIKGNWMQSGAKLGLDFRSVDALPTDKATEVWRGTMKAAFQKLEMQVRGYEQPDGSLQYFVDSLSQKAGGFKADATRDGDTFELDVPALKSKYVGKVQSDPDLIKGKWNQGVEINLDLRRVKSDDAPFVVPEVKRPQLPKPPFPYTAREVKFPSNDGEIQLSGTLTLPSGEGPFPLAILISGSGPQDRDETLMNHKPFLVLADHLTRKGIAVLRYDDRGVGESQGGFATATTQDFAVDAKSAVAFAQSLPEIDSRNIGLIGHSEGGVIAPIVAVADPSVAWIVMMAGTGVTGEQILYSQGQLILAAEGAAADAQKAQKQLQEVIFKAIRTIDPETKLESILDAKVDELMKEMSTDDKTPTEEELESLRSGLRSSLSQVHSPWFRYFLTYDPAPTLEKVRCPVLAINGERDLQVDPKLNLPVIEAALKKGGNEKVTIVELAGLNHLFQTCTTGSVSEYGAIEETFSPKALEAISSWIVGLR